MGEKMQFELSIIYGLEHERTRVREQERQFVRINIVAIDAET